MSRVLVLGDVHGGAKALDQVLQRANFDYENDTLISLGDIVDGWSETFECVEILLSIKNLIPIRGNHDDWFRNWLLNDSHNDHPIHWKHGGISTRDSYARHAGLEPHEYSSLTPEQVPESHRTFFTKTQNLYYIGVGHKLYVHGGFDFENYVSNTREINPSTFYWDRFLWSTAKYHHSIGETTIECPDEFKEIFIGHTATTYDNLGPEPRNCMNVWNLDTGGGFDGKLTLMDSNTKEYWQSDLVRDLYLDEQGRNRK